MTSTFVVLVAFLLLPSSLSSATNESEMNGISNPEALETHHFMNNTTALLQGHDKAFVTSVVEGFSIGALEVLHDSLLQTGHSEPLIVLVTSPKILGVLKQMTRLSLVKPLYVNSICTHGETGVQKAFRLIPFALQGLKVAVYIDLSSVVLQNIDDLFHKPSFSAVIQQHGDSFSLALLVLRPSMRIFGIFQKYHCIYGLDDRAIYRKIVLAKVWTRLKDVYGVRQEMMDNMWYSQQKIDVKVINFPTIKPWNFWKNGRGDHISVRAFTEWCVRSRRDICPLRLVQMKRLPSIPGALYSKGALVVLIRVRSSKSDWMHTAKYYARMPVVPLVVVLLGDSVEGNFNNMKIPKGPNINILSTMSRFLSSIGSFDPIFMCEDDIRVPEEDLERGFNTWRSNSQRLVGFFPRHVTRRNIVPPSIQDGYNLLLSKGLFVHRFFLFASNFFIPAKLRKIGGESSICQDLLLNIVVSGWSGNAPLHLKVKESIQRNLANNDEDTESTGCFSKLLSVTDVKSLPRMLGSMSVIAQKNREK